MIRFHRPSRDDRQIVKSGRNFLRISPEGFPQPALDPVPPHRVSGNPSPDGTGEPADPAVIRTHLKKHRFPAEAFPFPKQTLEIGTGKTLGAAQSLLSGGQLRDESTPALLPAALQHAPTSFLGHALAESVLVPTLQVGLVREVFLHARIVSPHPLQRPAIEQMAGLLLPKHETQFHRGRWRGQRCWMLVKRPRP